MKKILVFLILLVPVTAFAESQSIAGQWRGLNNGDASILIGDNEAQDLLNVDITDGGYGIKKRAGIVQFKTIGVSTHSVVSGYYFRDVAGKDTLVFSNDRSLYRSTYTSGSWSPFAAFITTDTASSRYDFVDSQGYVWRANSSRDQVARYDGTTVTYYPSLPLCTQIEVSDDRMIFTGDTSVPNQIYFSKSGDFTTTATGSQGTDPFTETIGFPGQKITAIKYVSGVLLIWTKDTLAQWVGSNQYDGVITNIDNRIGTAQPDTIAVDHGIVYWQAQDNHFYSYDFNVVQKISGPITGSVNKFYTDEANALSTVRVDINHRIMWTVGARDGANDNGKTNTTYIWDTRFGVWLKYIEYSVSAASGEGFRAQVAFGTTTYFGGTGVVYTWPVGTSDNSNAITAFWKSKEFIGGDPHAEKDFLSYSVLASSSSGSNIDVSYTVNTSSTVTNNFSLTADVTGASYRRINANLPSGKSGTFFNMKVGNDDASAPFEIYAVRYDYRPRPWRVLP